MGEHHTVRNSEGEDFEASRRVVISLDKKYRALSYAPSREGIVNMEKIRGCTVAKKCGFEDEVIKALDKASDVAVGALMVAPVPGARIAGAVVFAAKEDYKMIQGALDWADSTLFSNYFSNKRFLDEFLAASRANQNLLREELINEDYKAISGQVVEYEESDEIAAQALRLQFRIRAEAIYGLIALMTHAAIKTDKPKEYADKLEEYKVQAYIRNYILNDGWEFPLNTSLHISMDEFWLYCINPEGYVDGKPDESFGIDKDGLLVPQKVEFTMEDHADKKDNFINNYVLGEAYRMMLTDKQLPNNVKTEFASIFPVHHQATRDFYKLMQEFKTKYTELKDNDIYEFTMVYWRPQGYFKDSDWQNFDTNLEKDISISPLDEIRVIIVMKDDFDGVKRNKSLEKIDQEPYLNYPVYLQLVRTDGSDVRGPVYKGLTRTLTPEDLLDSEIKLKLEGKQGVVFKPFYQFRNQTLAGTKPLVPESDLSDKSVEEYYKDGDFRDMCYLYMVTVGRLNPDSEGPENQTTRVVRIQGDEKDYYNPDWSYVQGLFNSFEYEYKVTLSKNKTKMVPDKTKFKQICPKPTIDEDYEGKLDAKYGEEEILLNKAFLTGRTKMVSDVTVFPNGAHRIQVFMRFGKKGDYFLASEEFDSIINSSENQEFVLERLGNQVFLHQFDWDTPVEFIVVAVVSKIDKEICGTHGIDWRRVRISAGMCEYGDNIVGSIDNTEGPMLRKLRMDYIANVQKLNDTFVFFNDEVNIGSVDQHHKLLKPFVSQFHNLNDEQLKVTCGFDDRYAEKNYSVYASYISAGYESLTGEEVFSIRPFGSGDTARQYRGQKAGDQLKIYRKNVKSDINEVADKISDFFSGNLGRNTQDVDENPDSAGMEIVRYFRYGFNRFATKGKGIKNDNDCLNTVINIAAPASMYENVPWIRTDYKMESEAEKNNPLLYEWVNHIAPKGKDEIAKHVDEWIKDDATSLSQVKRKRSLKQDS